MIKKIVDFFKKNYTNIFFIFIIFFGFAATYALAVPKVVRIKAKIVNVRTGPMLSYNVIGQLKSDEQIPILQEKNGWYLVRLNGDKLGWIASWLTDATEIDSAIKTTGVINTNQTNVRLYSNTNSPIIKILNQGDKINIVYSKSSWSQIIIDGKVGWVNNRLFDLTDDSSNNNENTLNNAYVLEPNTKIHQNPDLNSPVLKSLKQREKLKVIGTQGNFYKIKDAQSTEGYVISKFVTTEIPKPITIYQPKSLAQTTIVIDAGHGGNDPGAQANNGRHYEKKYTLLVARELKAKLAQRGVKVIMTRDDDNSVKLEDRVLMTNQVRPNAFISLHLDSSPQANQAEGITTYYYSRKDDLPLAQSISTQFKHLKTTNRGVAFGNYEVLRDSFYPSILIELGYINNDHDFTLIKKPYYREQLTSKIVDGLANYFK